MIYSLTPAPAVRTDARHCLTCAHWAKVIAQRENEAALLERMAAQTPKEGA